MPTRLTVVVSQCQSKDPGKRQLEEDIVTRLLSEPTVELLIIPHLYDVRPETSADIALHGISGPFVLLSWLYPRAAHWILDRNGVRGNLGKTRLVKGWDKKKLKKTENELEKQRVVDHRPLPDRSVYHLDLRSGDPASAFVAEVLRIGRELSKEVVALEGGLAVESAERQRPIEGELATEPGPGRDVDRSESTLQRVVEEAGRRWYPVIDFSRCTNCMECIDFCLFGVYGIDGQETILVEQPDNCRKGCPACSRVCPENAIIFPQHKTPIIAGDPSVGGELKIDLSQLFGGPSSADVASRERDEQLVAAGRDAVGDVSLRSHRREQPADQHRDELDDLVDQLDDLDL